MKNLGHLFVYGTLGLGEPNQHVLTAIEGTYHPASVRGHLIDSGWGAALGYPGLVLDDKGEQIYGYVYTSSKLNEHLPRLDAFEGEGYQRKTTIANLSDGTVVTAYVYVVRLVN